MYCFKFGQFSAIISSDSLSASLLCSLLLGFPYVDMLLGISQVSEAPFTFLSSFYSLFLNLNNLNWPIFKFTESFFRLLKSAVGLLEWTFFISVIVFFNSRVSIRFLFIMSISLLIVSIWGGHHSHPFFSSSELLLFSSLTMFNIAVLKFLCSKSKILVPSWIIFIDCLLTPVYEPYFFCMPQNFLLKTGHFMSYSSPSFSGFLIVAVCHCCCCCCLFRDISG